MQRLILKNLIEWKNSETRKPLLLTGVRQCGKTFIIKEFGKTNFENSVYINFEERQQFCNVFDYDFDVERIIRELYILTGEKIESGKTLLFFDEIQQCPRAITSLKYFCENKSDLHIICAGSLLGVALKRGGFSFPVGKVTRMQMYPMNFEEFTVADGGEKYLEMLRDWSVTRPVPDICRIPLEKYLQNYLVIGGMPEVVSEWVKTHDYEKVRILQDEILKDYADDFSKYAPLDEVERIRWVWNSVPVQLAKDNNKFVFSHVKEGKRAVQLEDALQWLCDSGLVKRVEMVENPGIPLSSCANASFFKVYMSDTGLLCRMSGLTHKVSDDRMLFSGYKGALAENYVFNELTNQNRNLFYWRSGNSAELDFLFEHDREIIPVEVKAADNTQAKSYRLFCTRYSPEKGFKISMKNIALNPCENTQTVSLPLYLVWNINNFLEGEARLYPDSE